MPIRASTPLSVIIVLHDTINQLSRLLSQIQDVDALNHARHRGEPSVRELLLALRDEERWASARISCIATEPDPDLDRMVEAIDPQTQARLDAQRTPIQLLAEFRRLRQRTCATLRDAPDVAWQRVGRSRRGPNWTMHALAERLVAHDTRQLAAVQRAIAEIGAGRA